MRLMAIRENHLSMLIMLKRIQEPSQRHHAIVRDYVVDAARTCYGIDRRRYEQGPQTDQRNDKGVAWGSWATEKSCQRLNRRHHRPNAGTLQATKGNDRTAREGLHKGWSVPRELYTVDQALPGNVLVVKDKNGNRVELSSEADKTQRVQPEARAFRWRSGADYPQ